MAHLSTVIQPDQPCPRLSAWDFPGLAHGFMTRLGGASVGAYGSLNLADWVGDDGEAVRTNWEKWRAGYPGLGVAILKQVHGRTIHIIDHGETAPRKAGDGMATAATNLALAVFTADCVPILMIEPHAAVIAALHAGWRGTLANIAAEGIAAMQKLGAHPHGIYAALGPSIGMCCFEVDSALAQQFAREIPGADRWRRAGRAGKMYLDLRAIIRRQLERSGLDPAAIIRVGPCTKCESASFFSRRAAADSLTGLQMSFIALDRGP